jgi:hypothetical protein
LTLVVARKKSCQFSFQPRQGSDFYGAPAKNCQFVDFFDEFQNGTEDAIKSPFPKLFF